MLLRYGNSLSADRQPGTDGVIEAEDSGSPPTPCGGQPPWNAQITTVRPSQQATERPAVRVPAVRVPAVRVPAVRVPAVRVPAVRPQAPRPR
jgi:hypothetical protein